jgi:hypothetical protein
MKRKPSVVQLYTAYHIERRFSIGNMLGVVTSVRKDPARWRDLVLH